VLKGVDTSCCQDAGLPHGSAVHAAKPSGFVDEC
jgi:hypothetical protein